MIPLLSRTQIRAFDAHAIRQGVPSLILMENAARGATDVLVSELLGSASEKTVTVLCGTGNNGGDGFAIARRLLVLGAKVHLFLFGAESALTPDAKTNAAAFIGVGGKLLDASSLDASLDSSDAIVEALFGTGLSRPIEGTVRAVIEKLAPHRAKVLAVDIPSGLDADRGVVLGACVRAAITVTFAHWKLGLATPMGAEHTGRVVVQDIGVPRSLVTEVGWSGELFQAEDIAPLLPPRSPTAHKYTAGHVGVLAGSTGKVGAAKLVARGAHRAGAGAVTVATWSGTEDGEWLETMTAPLRRESIDADVDAFVARKAAVVCGPGFGLDEDAKRAVTRLLGHPVKVVLDADALSLFANEASTFAAARGRVVMTPHVAEAARLLGKDVAAVEHDRFAAARELAASTGAAVLLKGAYTIVAEGARLAVIDAGSVALATAGSGDVLAGVCGALLSSLSPFDAACAAAHLHGRSGERWAAAHTDRGMLASDIADGIPDALRELA